MRLMIFVCKYRWDQLSNLYNHLKKTNPAVTRLCIEERDDRLFHEHERPEALGYLMYAKRWNQM
jgi:hypothetical protein